MKINREDWLNTSIVEIIDNISTHHDYIKRKAIASDFRIRYETLFNLALDKDDRVKIGVVKNSKTPNFILEKFALFDSLDVKIAVAKSSKTPNYILRELAKFNEEKINIAILENNNCSLFLFKDLIKNLEILEKLNLSKINENYLYLLEEFDMFFIKFFLAEFSRNKVYLEQLFLEHNDKIDFKLAKNKNTHYLLLEKLSISKTEIIRAEVSANENTSTSVLEKLLKDDSYLIRIRNRIRDDIYHH